MTASPSLTLINRNSLSFNDSLKARALSRAVITAWALEDPKPAVPTLTVTGTGHLMIAPDMAYVTFGMQTSGKSLADAQRQNNNVMQKVITRLGELAIAAEHIQTSSFTVSPQYKPTPKHGGDVSPAPPWCSTPLSRESHRR